MRAISLGFVLGAAVLSGCASIVKGGTQDLSIATKPEGARFSVKNNRHGTTVVQGVTPGNISLDKGAGYFKGADYTVTLSKDGYVPQQVNIKSSASGWYIGGNLVIGGLLGWVVVDPLTGAMWKLTPEGIDAQLEPARAAVAPPMAPEAEYVPLESAAAPQPQTGRLARSEEPAEQAARPVGRSAYGSGGAGAQLEALERRRINGELSGEEYLAERRRILDSQ